MIHIGKMTQFSNFKWAKAQDIRGCISTLRSWFCPILIIFVTWMTGPGGVSPAHAGSPPQAFQVQIKSSNGHLEDSLYTPLLKAEKQWKICVLFPHLYDSYWLAVNYGIADQAKQLGVSMQLYHAGSYDNLAIQVHQIQDCIDKQADGVILAANTHDGLNPLIAELHKRKIPVIDLINGISSPLVSAHSRVSYYDIGYAIGKYVADHFASSPLASKVKEQNLAWFPGPANAGWVQDGSHGFFHGLENSNITILTARHGNTDRKTQSRLINEILDEHPQTDIIVGTAVTAEAAVTIARKRRISSKLEIMAYYFTPGIYRGIKRGQIKAAPSDSPVIQARIAMDQIIRILENKPYEKFVSPKIQLIDRMNVNTFDRRTTLAPSGFRPTFVVNGGLQ